MKAGFSKLDLAQLVTDLDDQEYMLNDALATGDANYIAHVIGIIARAKSNMNDISSETGIARSGLYKAFGKEGNPTLSTLLMTLKSLGYRLEIKAL